MATTGIICRFILMVDDDEKIHGLQELLIEIQHQLGELIIVVDDMQNKINELQK